MKTSKSMNNKFFKRQKGQALLEALLALVLIIAAILYGVNKYNDGDEQTNLNEEQSNWTRIIPKIKSKYATAPDFTGVTIDVLRNEEIFPDNMVSGTSVHSLFGGAVGAAVSSTANGTNDAITITVAGYSKKACNGITDRIEQSVYTMSVNGTPVKAANSVLDRAATSTACVAGSNNTLTFQVSKV